MSPRTQLVSTHRLFGSATRVFTYRAAPEQSRGVLLAVHGFRGDHHGLDRIIAQLPGYTVVVPDLPGFGGSSSMTQAPHDVEGYARMLDVLADQLQLGPATHLLGHSFGSIIAARLAAGRGFASLSLLNPISEPALESSQALLARVTSGYYALCAALPSGIGEPLLRSKLFTDSMSLVMTKSRDPQMRRYVREQHRAYFGGFHSRDTLAEAYLASISHTVGEYSRGIGIPTLMVGGQQDELGSPATQEALRATFADARLLMLPDVGHLIHYEKAPETAAAVRRFLEGLGA